MNESIQRMALEIADVLGPDAHSVWLYGSVVLGDFHLGWSDIDFIAFSNAPISQSQAEGLLDLRQRLSARYPDNPYFRCFEGVTVCLREYLTGSYTRLVYWGTSGQRVTDRYQRDVFAQMELAKFGRRVYGQGERGIFSVPDRAEIVAAIRHHLRAIRSCAAETDESLYACGWLLDIARCMYTLRYGEVIGKTQAGQWALGEHVFPDEAALQKTLTVRRHPLQYKDDPQIRAWLKTLGPTVQQYADVLEKELKIQG